MKKEYQFKVRIISDNKLTAESKKEAREIIKDVWAEEHNIDLADEEISSVKVRKERIIYLIEIDIGEGIPCFTFTVRAKNKEEATKKGLAVAESDYPDEIKEVLCCEPIKRLKDIEKYLTVDY